MKVYWIQCKLLDVPSASDWLHPGESENLSSLKFEKRRQEWLLGRWTAKQALMFLPGQERGGVALSVPAEIEIRAAADGAPEIFVRGARTPFSVSISHRDDRAVCALAPGPVRLGCDLERIEKRSRAFIADYLAERERLLVNHAAPADRDLLVNLIWSAKESALKALRTGLRRDTRSVVVSFRESPQLEWKPFDVVDAEGKRTLPGWMKIDSQHVLTVVSDREFPKPVQLGG